jgi:four helix bundle protein
MAVQSFEQLEVWQRAHGLTLEVYKQSQQLPEEEEFGLFVQMRKAATRVPALIASGFRRRNMRSKLRSYNKSQAALEELRYFFILCRDLKYPLNHEELAYQGDQVARMISGLVRSIAVRQK